MNRSMALVAVAALSLTVISCGLLERFTGGPEMKKVDTLWNDVPKMDDMTSSEIEMPIGTKLLLRTIIGNLGRFNKEGEDRTTGDIDWLSFTSPKPPNEIQEFYTNQRMSEFGGWETSKESTCVSGSEKGVSGAFCVFQKKADGKKAGLVVIAAQDEKTSGTNLFFVRIETDDAAPKK